MNSIKKVILLLSTLYLGIICNGQQALNNHNFPIPEKTNEQLFYLQRSLNKNTIIYDICFDNDGIISKSNPVNVYWIRYDEDNRVMPLRILEKNLAFGVKTKELFNQNFDYQVTLAASNKRPIFLKQEAPYQVTAFLKIDGIYSKLDHIFIQSDPDGLLTRIEYVELYAERQNSSTLVCKRIQL